MSCAEVLVLGGGPAGLSAGVLLQRRHRSVQVVERAPCVGGLTRTEVHGGFRFDLGGHRFYTKNRAVHAFVADLLGEDLVPVDRLSRIHFRGRFVDYPIRPLNALRHVGPATSARILADLVALSLRPRPAPPASLQEWMLASYGPTLFRTYFKVYAEKVWGMPADRIDAGLAAQRVKGLGLGATLRHAMFRRSRAAVESMVERFHYPRYGYGQIGTALAAELAPAGALSLSTHPVRIEHDGHRIRHVDLRGPDGPRRVTAEHMISSIPLPALLRCFDPTPPQTVQDAVARLGYRAVVFVAVFVDRPTVRPESWIYFPSPEISFGRITEPRNWSPRMAPEGQTSIVAEHFCEVGDATWEAADVELARRTITDLCDRLAFFRPDEVLGTAVVRASHAYPRMDVDHVEPLRTIERWVDGFANLQLIGRTGMFRYHNTDHVIETAFAAVENVTGGEADLRSINTALSYHEERRTG